jgi:hypothetical protein
LLTDCDINLVPLGYPKFVYDPVEADIIIEGISEKIISAKFPFVGSIYIGAIHRTLIFDVSSGRPSTSLFAVPHITTYPFPVAVS